MTPPKFLAGDRVRINMPGCKLVHHPTATVTQDQEGRYVVLQCDGYTFETEMDECNLVKQVDTP